MLLNFPQQNELEMEDTFLSFLWIAHHVYSHYFVGCTCSVTVKVLTLSIIIGYIHSVCNLNLSSDVP